jgi:lipoprotein-anchoring transpeptidase ErfK/SrfK
VIVFQPVQAFGAYEHGVLVRWGPVSTGARTAPTPSGLFHLNWRQREHTSTVDPDWAMPWSFNFENRLGLAFHAQALPGKPASHGCVRLLVEDAQWLFDWGEPWTVDPGGTRVLRLGTPVLVIGEYNFEAQPPWQLLHRLARPVELPPQ